jgi:hypothetical protein
MTDDVLMLVVGIMVFGVGTAVWAAAWGWGKHERDS